MDRGARQVRLAITVFEDVADLVSTLRALKSQGFAGEQLCIAASEPVMQRAETEASGKNAYGEELRPLVEDLRMLAQLPDGGHVMATSGSLLDTLSKALSVDESSAERKASSTGPWPELTAGLLGDAIALIVRSESAQQHVVATRTLLRASSHRVRTYDYTMAPAPGTDGSVD